MTDAQTTDHPVRAVPFTVPSGGTDALLATIANQDPSLPTFVYERLDPTTRRPTATWIGLATAATETAAADDPFDLLRQQLIIPGNGEAPGEVFSLIGFPQGDRFVQRKDTASTAMPRAVFLAMGIYVRIDHQRGLGHVIEATAATADPEANSSLNLVDWAGILEAAMPAGDPELKLDSQEAAFAWEPSISANEFADGVHRFQQRMAGADEIGGVVLSVQMISPTRSDPLASYRALRHINPSTCMFLLRHGEFALWGATSLSLVQVKDGHLIAETDGATHPVPDLPPGQTFTWTPSDKEIYEYDVVAAALHDDLDPVSRPGTLLFTREREQRTFFGLSHLFAEMQADLGDNIDAVRAVQALFPHGAAVGHPRKAALELIDEFELVPRGPFSGMVGIFGVDGSADVAAVTRSMWTTPSGSYAQAGAKVVPASNAQAEYNESILKTKAVRAAARQVVE